MLYYQFHQHYRGLTMPRKCKVECRAGGCHTLTHDTYCEVHDRQERKEQARGWKRGARSQIPPSKRGYDRQWRRFALDYLARNKYCCVCAQEGVVRAATIVDHIIPLRFTDLAIDDESNLQPICASHHASKCQTERHLKKPLTDRR